MEHLEVNIRFFTTERLALSFRPLTFQLSSLSCDNIKTMTTNAAYNLAQPEEIDVAEEHDNTHLLLEDTPSTGMGEAPEQQSYTHAPQSRPGPSRPATGKGRDSR
jgi:hypothetical protein